MTEGRPSRVSRGGCWSRGRLGVRVARRIIEDPDDRYESRGIRLVEVFDDPEPTPAASGSARVVRGGGWGNVPRLARLANRIDFDPGRRNRNLGVRLVEVVEDEEEGSK